MSGDPEPKDEPKIFYSEEITVTKLIALKQQKDPVDDYFDCVSSCDTDNKECHDECIEELKENDFRTIKAKLKRQLASLENNGWYS